MQLLTRRRLVKIRWYPCVDVRVCGTSSSIQFTSAELILCLLYVSITLTLTHRRSRVVEPPTTCEEIETGRKSGEFPYTELGVPNA